MGCSDRRNVERLKRQLAGNCSTGESESFDLFSNLVSSTLNHVNMFPREDRCIMLASSLCRPNIIVLMQSDGTKVLCRGGRQSLACICFHGSPLHLPLLAGPRRPCRRGSPRTPTAHLCGVSGFNYSVRVRVGHVGAIRQLRKSPVISNSAGHDRQEWTISRDMEKCIGIYSK